jgi:putative tricarboxylic transport membrane protein
MIGSGGDMAVFWSNGLVGSITSVAIALLFCPLIDKAFGSVARLWRPVKTAGKRLVGSVLNQSRVSSIF